MSQATDIKLKIILATLEIIKTQGMRAVRHRAVATLAGVSLGSTTYHFKSIEDLISETFIFWLEREDVGKNPYFISIEQDVDKLEVAKVDPLVMLEQVINDSEQYLRNQIFDRSDNRKIELAFHNEALYSGKLSLLLRKSWQTEVNRIARLYKSMGSSMPEQDAEVTFALILQLEKKAMLISDQQELEQYFKSIAPILKRHITLLTHGVLH